MHLPRLFKKLAPIRQLTAKLRVFVSSPCLLNENLIEESRHNGGFASTASSGGTVCKEPGAVADRLSQEEISNAYFRSRDLPSLFGRLDVRRHYAATLV